MCHPDPIGSDVGGTVVEDDVDHVIEFVSDVRFDERPALGVLGDILCDGDDVLDGLDRHQIESHDDTLRGHVLAGDLEP
jgi:hypothetical protein